MNVTTPKAVRLVKVSCALLILSVSLVLPTPAVADPIKGGKPESMLDIRSFQTPFIEKNKKEQKGGVGLDDDPVFKGKGWHYGWAKDHGNPHSGPFGDQNADVSVPSAFRDEVEESITTEAVPDGGMTLILLASTLGGLAVLPRRFRKV